jgi:hypothetical protein
VRTRQRGGVGTFDQVNEVVSIVRVQSIPLGYHFPVQYAYDAVTPLIYPNEAVLS